MKLTQYFLAGRVRLDNDAKNTLMTWCQCRKLLPMTCWEVLPFPSCLWTLINGITTRNVKGTLILFGITYDWDNSFIKRQFVSMSSSTGPESPEFIHSFTCQCMCLISDPRLAVKKKPMALSMFSFLPELSDLGERHRLADWLVVIQPTKSYYSREPRERLPWEGWELIKVRQAGKQKWGKGISFTN